MPIDREMREAVHSRIENPPNRFTRSAHPFRIVGGLHSVGTHDLSVFLITTREGHILINSGVRGSTQSIGRNIEALGHRLEDVRLLLTMQSHWDHVADLAEIKRVTGARMLASKTDVRVLEDGGLSDPHFGGSVMFEPISVDERLEHHDTIELGGTSLRMEQHPGHTEGSCSFTMTVTEEGRDYSVLLANMPTVNAGKRLVYDQTYPGVAEDFEETFRRQKALDVDIWVAAHASHYGLHDKRTLDQPYSPDTFVDPDGYFAAVANLESVFLELVDTEKEAPR